MKKHLYKSFLIKTCIVLLLSMVFITSYVHAESQEITNGLNWLKNNQNADGSWGGVNNFRDTTAKNEIEIIL